MNLLSIFIQRPALQRPSTRKIFAIAWPMILANISVPLLGFVDTAVIGHLPDSQLLAGTALGGLLLSVLFWLFGFLRMSTTGLSAQACGAKDSERLSLVLWQGGVLALLLASILLLLQTPIFQILAWSVATEQGMSGSLTAAQSYYQIRIWMAPIVLMNMVFTGYLIGIGHTKLVLRAVILCNLVNLVADLAFVPWLGFGVEGVAWATVLAETTQFLLLIFGIGKGLKFSARYQTLLDIPSLFQLFKINLTLFCRGLLLQGCLSFMTIYASRFGHQAVAANAILMQFFLFISFALDGLAYALEALVGQSLGNKRRRDLVLFVQRGWRWGAYFGLLYTLVYIGFAETIIELLTNQVALRTYLADFHFWIYAMPLVCFMSFVMDGIFIGLGWAKEMRNTMFMAFVGFYGVILAISVTDSLTNHGLWLAFFTFMALRGTTQVVVLKRQL